MFKDQFSAVGSGITISRYFYLLILLTRIYTKILTFMTKMLALNDAEYIFQRWEISQSWKCGMKQTFNMAFFLKVFWGWEYYYDHVWTRRQGRVRVDTACPHLSGPSSELYTPHSWAVWLQAGTAPGMLQRMVGLDEPVLIKHLP